MNTLGRRLDTLEQIAEDCRRGAMRAIIVALPEAADLTSTELEDATDEALRFLSEIRSKTR